MKVLNILLEITIYSGILFCAIMLLKLCFKNRMSPFLHFVVWGLLIARLLIPVTLESAVHLFVIPAETSSETENQEHMPKSRTEPALDTDTYYPGHAQLQTNVSGQAQSAAMSSTETKNTPTIQQTTSLSTEEILLAVWLTGAAIGVLYLAGLYVLLRRRIKRNAQKPTQHFIKLFNEVKAELNIKRNVKIMGQCEYGTPAVLFPNIVLMPVGTVVSLSDDEVKFVLRHELMHFKRRDHITGLLLSLLNAVYWFNPIVWLASRQIHADMETACDSGVVRHFSSEEKTAYAAVILSLFSRKQYGNLALGMARGDTRQIAERRIKGVFMNHQSNRKVKITAVLLTSLLLLTCFTTACQPTPETPPVIRRVEDIPKEAILETDTPPAEVKNAVEPAAYSVMEHWKETVKKNDLLSIEVDADILMPEAAAYPVERLERIVLTQEKVNELIAYFTEPGTKFYTGEDVRLKSEYEEELIYLKQNLQKVLDGGDGETPESIRSYIKEVESKLAKAPESHTYTYVEPVFTYEVDYETGEPRKEYGENTINVSIESPDGGRYGYVSASRYEKGKSTRSHFSYSSFSGGWMLERYLTWEDELLRREMENPPQYAQTDGGEWHKDMTRQREYVDAGLKSMQGNNMNLRAAADRAIRLLEELGIEGMQLKSYEKAMCSKERDKEDYTIPACYVEFVRECGGIPSVSHRGGFSREQDYSELYCAPFGREYVNMFISEEGVESFSWGGMSQVLERTAENTTLMPIDQMKQRILDHVYFMNAAWLDHAQSGTKRIKINEIRLVTTYINAKDDTERVLIVPAWHIMAQEEYLHDHVDDWSRGNQKEFMINALDGSGILSPGTLEIMKNRPW